MKILMLIDSLDIGGAETHVISLAREMMRRGNAVKVVSAGGMLASRLERVGARHVGIPDIRGLGGGGLLCSIPKILLARSIIMREILASRPDIVHAHTRRTALLVSGICRSQKIPLVTTAHAKFSMSAIKRALSCWGDGTIAVSEDIKKHLIQACALEERKIKVIFNGIELPERHEF